MSDVDEATAFKQKGNEYFLQQKYVEAVKQYEKAAKADPSSAVYWSNIAVCCEKLKDYGYCYDAAVQSVRLDPSWAKGHYRLAKVQCVLYMFNEAKASIDKAVDLEPTNVELRTYQENLNERISSRDQHFHIVVLSIPPEGCFKCFGGSGLGGGQEENHTSAPCIPSGSFYSEIHRPAVPPCATKEWQLAQGSNSSDARYAMECICTKDLDVTWADLDDMFVLEVFLPDDKKPVFVLNIKLQQYEDQCLVGAGYATYSNPRYNSQLTVAQKEAIKIIAWSRFMRSAGTLLKPFSILAMCDFFAGECQKIRLYKDAADCRLVLCDLKYNAGVLSLTDLVKLGEALEAAKQYKKAAGVYLDCANGTFGRNPSYPEEMVRGFAALSFKRAMDYVSAEQEYVGALRAAGSDWKSLNDDSVRNNNLNNMMIFYEITHRAVESGLKTDEAHRKMQRSCMLLVGLLSIAGFRCKGCTLFQSKKLVAEFKGMLLSQHKRPKSALAAIKTAFAAPTIEVYHEILFSYQDPRKMVFFVGTPNTNDAQELLKSEKDKSKSLARDHTKDSSSTISGRSLYTCSSCGDSFAKLKQCPCGTVHYCGEKCQHDDWPRHKRVCPRRKNRT